MNDKLFFSKLKGLIFTAVLATLALASLTSCTPGDSPNALTTIGDSALTTAPETSTAPTQTTNAPQTSNVVTTTSPITTTAPSTTSSQAPQTTTVPTTTSPTTTAPTTTSPSVEPKESEMVRVLDYIPDIYVDLRYSGENNLAGTSIYNYTDAYLRYGTVKKLAKVQDELRKDDLSLVIWDAYRPYNMQHKLFMILPECATDPKNGKYTNFNTGGTLSLAIVNADGSALPLPSDFDESGSAADRDFSDVSAKRSKYAKLLDELMLANGFEQYLTTKWYRYTDSKSYPIDYTMTLDKEGVTVCEKWTVNCDKTLNLRKYASTSSTILTRIPKGTKVTVLFMQTRFAYIDYKGTRGYVVASYLKQSDENGWQSDLTTVIPVQNYTYAQMNADLASLAVEFPELLSISSIGKSELGKELTLAILGNKNAEKKIFVSAAIHAREHMTALYSVAQIEYMLRNPDKTCDGVSYTIGELLEKTCIYVVPMSNPDGIEIVQTGVIPDAFKDKYSSSPLDIASLWKANALGIDLNNNFDAEWDKVDKKPNASKTPGYLGYKGTSPECAAESKALADFVREYDFDLVLCYHTQGSVIYWEYGDNKKVIAQSKQLAERIAASSGYILDDPGSTSVAGLKDYVMSKLETPSLTIEFGTEAAPGPLRDFNNIWARTKDALVISADWLLE